MHTQSQNCMYLVTHTLPTGEMPYEE
jgi:hypothetical protein